VHIGFARGKIMPLDYIRRGNDPLSCLGLFSHPAPPPTTTTTTTTAPTFGRKTRKETETCALHLADFIFRIPSLGYQRDEDGSECEPLAGNPTGAPPSNNPFSNFSVHGPTLHPTPPLPDPCLRFPPVIAPFSPMGTRRAVRIPGAPFRACVDSFPVRTTRVEMKTSRWTRRICYTTLQRTPHTKPAVCQSQKAVRRYPLANAIAIASPGGVLPTSPCSCR